MYHAMKTMRLPIVKMLMAIVWNKDGSIQIAGTSEHSHILKRSCLLCDITTVATKTIIIQNNNEKQAAISIQTKKSGKYLQFDAYSVEWSRNKWNKCVGT